MRNEWIKMGELSILIDNGFIRNVKWQEVEVLRGIYSAVRDENWNTILPELYFTKSNIYSHTFELEFQAIYIQNDVNFEADYIVRGNATGEIELTMSGVSLTSFLKNRIGFCVLHPIQECISNQCLIEHTDGSIENQVFPQWISPHQPFLDIKSMKWGTEHGFEATLQFEGDVFETEDQRNWTDTSFKTYCTPLKLPFPSEVKAGNCIHQKVRFTFKSLVETAIIPPKQALVSRINKPAIGLGISTFTDTLTEVQIATLKKLNLNHLRVDLYMFLEDWQQKFELGENQARSIQTKIELVLHFTENWEEELNQLSSSYLSPNQLSSIIVFEFRKAGLPKLWNQKMIPLIKSRFNNVPIGVGTDANFAEFNRATLNLEGIDFVTFSINPQVHSEDDLTLIENIDSQYDVVKSAINKSNGLPVHIHAITLKRRFNSVCINPLEIPIPLTDSRQVADFCADWTDQSLAMLTKAGVASATYYETIGPRGIMNADIYPVYDIFLGISDK